MPRVRPIAVYNLLQGAWASAYESGRFIFDFSKEAYPIRKAMETYEELGTYRAWVRRRRLNPLLKAEWTRIQCCQLKKPRQFETKLTIFRFITNKQAKVKKDYKKYPMVALNLPTSMSKEHVNND